jgi:tetratricopeptide (TPR) repeat protein
MASGPRGNRYCRCGTLLAKDNAGRQCARCVRDSRDRLIAPPEVPPGFWQTQQFREAFAAQHMGRVSRVYRMHQYHHAVYGPAGISQTLLGQWIGLRQPQISRLEAGPPIRQLDTLHRWARVLRIPSHLLWFQLPEETQRRALAAPPLSAPNGTPPASNPSHAPADGTERDPILAVPWNHRGTVEAVVVLSGGDRMRRRAFLSLTGPALTAPAHQWLVHEPEPLISGLSGRRISIRLADRLTAMIAELRKMDDVAGGGSVLALGQQHFGWVAGLLNEASYDDATGRKLHKALAELGQFCGWAAYDAGDFGLAQRYYITGLRAAHTADDRPFGAHILATMANQAADLGQPAEAVTFVETALAGTRGHAPPALLAELHIRQAFGFAASREASACHAAISQARTQGEQLKPDDDPPWLYWMDPAAISVDAGECLLRLGQPNQAARMLHKGLAQFSRSLVRDRQIVTTHLANALSRPGKQRDLEAAAGLGMQSLDLAESLDSTRGDDRIRGLYFQMKPHAKVPAVRDFLERAKDPVGA